jgi:hypothetical protein
MTDVSFQHCQYDYFMVLRRLTRSTSAFFSRSFQWSNDESNDDTLSKSVESHDTSLIEPNPSEIGNTDREFAAAPDGRLDKRWKARP